MCKGQHCFRKAKKTLLLISIHAPHVRGDWILNLNWRDFDGFQFTPPRKGRQQIYTNFRMYILICNTIYTIILKYLLLILFKYRNISALWLFILHQPTVKQLYDNGRCRSYFPCNAVLSGTLSHIISP